MNTILLIAISAGVGAGTGGALGFVLGMGSGDRPQTDREISDAYRYGYCVGRSDRRPTVEEHEANVDDLIQQIEARRRRDAIRIIPREDEGEHLAENAELQAVRGGPAA